MSKSAAVFDVVFLKSMFVRRLAQPFSILRAIIPIVGLAIFIGALSPSVARADISFTDDTTKEDQDAFNKIIEQCKASSKKFKNWMETGWTEPTPGTNYSAIPPEKSRSIERNSTSHVKIRIVHKGDYIDAWQGNTDHTTTINVNIDNLKLLPLPTKNADGQFVMPAGNTQWALTQIDDIAHFLSEAWSTAQKGGNTTTLSVSSHQEAISGPQNEVRKELKLPLINSQTLYTPGKPEFPNQQYQPYTYYKTGESKPTPVKNIVYIQIATGKGYEWITFGEGGKLQFLFLNNEHHEVTDLSGGPISYVPPQSGNVLAGHTVHNFGSTSTNEILAGWAFGGSSVKPVPQVGVVTSAGAAVPPTLRPEGFTEFAGDILLHCEPACVTFGVGETTLFSNATVGWGVSPYGVVNTTFNKAQVMPTVELNVPLVAGNVGTMPLLFSLDLTAMFPTGGTSTQTVTLGGYTGTLGFQQGFFGTAEIEAKIPLGVPIGTPPNAGAWSLVFGGGLAVDQTKTSAVFPTAYDNFSSTNTDIQPLVTAGLTFPLFNGIEAEVKVSETFSGTGMNIIGVNGSSQGQYQVNNVTAITAKLTTPLDEIGALLDELLPIHGPPVH